MPAIARQENKNDEIEMEQGEKFDPEMQEFSKNTEESTQRRDSEVVV